MNIGIHGIFTPLYKRPPSLGYPLVVTSIEKKKTRNPSLNSYMQTGGLGCPAPPSPENPNTAENVSLGAALFSLDEKVLLSGSKLSLGGYNDGRQFALYVYRGWNRQSTAGNGIRGKSQPTRPWRRLWSRIRPRRSGMRRPCWGTVQLRGFSQGVYGSRSSRRNRPMIENTRQNTSSLMSPIHVNVSKGTTSQTRYKGQSIGKRKMGELHIRDHKP